MLLLNETKLNDEHLEQHAAVLPGYTAHWATATVKKGYSGVAAFTRDGLGVTSVTRGIGIPKHDAEGRVVTVELPQAFVTGTYTPNSGMKLERLDYRTNDWDPAFLAYIKGLKARKPVILAGDLNVAHEEIDIHNPKGNANKTPGFCDGERENFTALLKEGFVDAWRAANPGVPQFSYWSYRFNAKAQNKVSNGRFVRTAQHVSVGAPAARSAAAIAVAACRCVLLRHRAHPTRRTHHCRVFHLRVTTAHRAGAWTTQWCRTTSPAK